MKTDTARAKIWQLSHDMLAKILMNLMKVEKWDDKTVYLASQLNTIAIISGTLKTCGETINVGNILKSRVILDCAINAIAGCTEDAKTVDGKLEPSFVECELEKLKLSTKDRKPRKGYHRTQYENHTPDKWKSTNLQEEGKALKKIGNALLHSDPDAGYLIRVLDLKATDIKGLSLAIVGILSELAEYFDVIGASITQDEADKFMESLKQLLDVQLIEQASYNGEFSPFEERLYKELELRGAKSKIAKNFD